jgi:hypothetical protein
MSPRQKTEMKKGPVYRCLADDHARLDLLLQRALADPERIDYRLTVISFGLAQAHRDRGKSITAGSSASAGWRTPAGCRQAAHPTRRTGSASCSLADVRNWRGYSRNPERPQSSRKALEESTRGAKDCRAPKPLPCLPSCSRMRRSSWRRTTMGRWSWSPHAALWQEQVITWKITRRW